MPYVFYDTETTGIETPFDQILQFAAIRTDDALNELERFNIRCRLLPHIIPSPKALLITQVTPAILTDPELPSHYTMIRQIRDTLLAWSPATFIGFNSMSFDEDLLRQALFQDPAPQPISRIRTETRGLMSCAWRTRSACTRQTRWWSRPMIAVGRCFASTVSLPPMATTTATRTRRWPISRRLFSWLA